jgi:hypothetical protein
LIIDAARELGGDFLYSSPTFRKEVHHARRRLIQEVNAV